jgi:6,7-dimethyl-8-ribityllumazine synthase
MARFDNIRELDISLNGAGLRVGIVMSRFNRDAGEGLHGRTREERRA